MFVALPGIDKLGVFKALPIQPGAHKFSRLADLSGKGLVRADAGDTKEPDEVVHFPYNGIFIRARW
jgi:hypothetical protein